MSENRSQNDDAEDLEEKVDELPPEAQFFVPEPEPTDAESPAP